MNYQNPYQMYQPYIQNPYSQNTNWINGQNMQFNAVNGRYVDNFDAITANDVCMGGQPSVFPKNDLSQIEVRKWNSDGTISRTLFEPINLPKLNKVSNSSTESTKSLESAFKCVTEPLEERLDRIEELLKPKTSRKKVENES